MMQRQIVPWSPWVGCSHVGASCALCYIPRLIDGPAKTIVEGRHLWTGELQWQDSELQRPSLTCTPATFVVVAHGDFFHDAAPDEWRDRVMEVVERETRHDFIIGTKRSACMRDYFLSRYPTSAPDNVYCGVSFDDQSAAETRIPDLISLPFSRKFLVAYPLLGPINIRLVPGFRGLDFTHLECGSEPERPAEEEWFETLRKDCLRSGLRYLRGDLGSTVGARGW